MDARKFFGASFISLKDVADRPIQATIDSVREGSYGKLEVVFESGDAFSLNAGNTRVLSRTYGPETDSWIGHTVELAAGETMYQGKMQPSVVVTPISAPITPAAPETEKRPVPAGADMGDDIPF